MITPRAKPAFADLEIRVLPLEDAGYPAGYPVEITLNHDLQYARGFLSPDLPTGDGARLFAWLFADSTLKEAWEHTRGQYPQRRIRLRIDAAAPELHALPWEALRDPNSDLDLAAADATPFSRYLAGTWPPGSPIPTRPIKVLVAIVNPDNLSDYNLAALDEEAEWANLCQATGEKYPSLAYPWLQARLDEKLPLIFTPTYKKAIQTAIDVLDVERRGQILYQLPDTDTLAEMATYLIGEDIDLYQKFLESECYKFLHLAPLSCAPEGIWIEMAKLASDAGYSSADIAKATRRYTGVSVEWGPVSQKWEMWMRRFEKLCKHEDARIREIGRIGIEARHMGENPSDGIRGHLSI